jgi:hypothetical protein
MSDDLPPPPVEPHVDCSDLDGFMLNAERLMSSELLALHGSEMLGPALLLWCRAWKQRPAASLPDDDRINAAYSGLPLKKFLKVKDAIMRGFVKCSDGRLYHRFLAAEAMKAYEKKLAFRKRRATDATRLKGWRNSRRETPIEPVSTDNETAIETHDETRFVADGNGKDRDRDRDRDRDKKDLPLEGPKKAGKGSRLSPDWRPNDDGWREAVRLLGSQRAETELAKFRDYWIAKPGKDALKLDWDATWRNWVRTAGERSLPSADWVR